MIKIRPVETMVTSPTSAWRNTALIGTFLVTLLGTCFCLHAFLPPLGTTDPILLRKMEHFAEHRDQYNVVFFGSSQIYRNIIPRVFDDEMAKHGHKTKSFNFGIGGMRPHETNLLIRQVLAMGPRNLRYAFVELGSWHPASPARNHFTKRMVAWHARDEAASILRSLWIADDPWPRKWNLLYVHARHALANYFNIGQGPRYLRRWVGARDDIRYDRDTPHAVEEEGFVGHTADPVGRGQANSRTRMLENPSRYHRLVDTLVKRRFQSSGLEHYNTRVLEEQVKQFQDRGIAPAYLIPPRVNSLPEAQTLLRQGVIPALFAFNDPTLHPAIYDIRVRFDLEHLLVEGAEMFTRELANQFARQIDGSPPKAKSVP